MPALQLPTFSRPSISISTTSCPRPPVALLCLLIAAPLGAQVEVDKVLPEVPGTLSGNSVALDGEMLAVGSVAESVRLYRLSGETWLLEQILEDPADAPQTEFGFSVDLQGDTLLVGAPSDGAQGLGAGAAHVYRRTGDGWLWTSKLTGLDTTSEHHFGRSVALDGNRAVVGAPFVADFGESSGAVYVFEFGEDGWLQDARLTDPQGTEYARLGSVVAIEGDTVVAGADGDSSAAPASGAALVYRRNAVGWLVERKLTPEDPTPLKYYGESVAISAGAIVIGARGDTEAGAAAGAVYTYRDQGDGPELEQKLSPPGAGSAGSFGHTVRVSGSRLVVSTRADRYGLQHVGTVEMYEHGAGGWSWVGSLLPSNPIANSFFGSAVDMAGERIACGAPLDSEAGAFAGAVFLYSASEFAAPYCLCASAAPCGNDDPGAGCANATGRGARLEARGSASVSADDLVLVATQLPPFQPAIVCVGVGRVRSPLANGQFCLSDIGGIRRFPVSAADADGGLLLGRGIATFTQEHFGMELAIQPGTTRHFQVWYRDPAGPCGSSSNLSNGLTVSFGI